MCIRDRAEEMGGEITELLKPVAAIMSRIPTLQAEYDQTRQAMGRLTGQSGSGYLDGRVMETSKLDAGFLKDLNDLCNRVH